MKPILSPHDNFPRPTAWTRTTAIESFGVTYLHDTAKGAPIREVLGRQEAPPSSTGSTITAHATDGEAIAYASNLARVEAQRELDDIETHLAGKATRFRLALARNWKPAREREVGLLATESIMDRRRRECREIVERGVRPPVKRLPEGLRMPIVLPLLLPVHLVDMREFPMREIQLEESHIVSHSFVEVEGHPAYDVVVRYHVKGIQGAFSYDHPGLVHKTLEGTPDGLRIFLLHGAAVSHIHDFSQTVQDRLVQGLTPVVSIAPRSLPSPQSLARPEPEPTPPVPAIQEEECFEAEVIPFPAPAPDTAEFSREWVEESRDQAPEPVDMEFTEILPTTEPAVVDMPIAAIAVAGIPQERDPSNEPAVSPAHVETELPMQLPASTDAIEAPVEDLIGFRVLDAVEAALAIDVAPVNESPSRDIDDEFDGMIAQIRTERPAPSAKPTGTSMLSKLASFLRPKETSVEAAIPVAKRVEPTIQPDAAFVREALDFAASEEAVELPIVRASAPTTRRSEIEGFLRRGTLLIDRPERQPERDSLALALLGTVAPDLLEPVQAGETIAA